MAYRKEVAEVLGDISKCNKQIDKLKKTFGLSQAQIARLIGVPEQTLNYWYHGTVTCQRPRMLSLALEALENKLK